MTVSSSPLSYEDCYSLMQAALEDDRGVRVKMIDLNAATFLRLRCHQARSIERKRNAETYERPDPRHGVSEYDRLTLRLREDSDGVWVVFEQNNTIPGEVESLSSGELVQMDLPLVIPAPSVPKALPAPASKATPAEKIFGPSPSDADLAEAFEQIPTVAEVLEPSAPGPRSNFKRL